MFADLERQFSSPDEPDPELSADPVVARLLPDAYKDDPEKAAAEHPKSCALKDACVKSGYAVISGKTMWKLDAKGNILAKEFLEKSTKDADIRVIVDGAKKGDEIAVEGIVAAPDAK